MSQVQSGILPEHCRAAIWIEANVKGDINALRAPGSEVKEAYMPTFMVYGSYELRDNLTLEGYWQPGTAWARPRPAGAVDK